MNKARSTELGQRPPVNTMVLRNVLTFLPLVLPLLTGCQPESVDPPAIRAEFGIWTMDAAGEFHFVPRDSVQNVEDQPFGWRIWVGPSNNKIRWTETLTLPAPAASWEGTDSDPDITVSADRRTATTIRETLPDNGFLSNIWFVASGDPPGEYQLTVELPGNQKENFRFQMEEAGPTGKEVDTTRTTT